MDEIGLFNAAACVLAPANGCHDTGVKAHYKQPRLTFANTDADDKRAALFLPYASGDARTKPDSAAPISAITCVLFVSTIPSRPSTKIRGV